MLATFARTAGVAPATTQRSPGGAGTPTGAYIEIGVPMQIDRTRMYRVKAVADMADVSVSTVYRAIESGSLNALRIGTAVRVPGAALAAWIAKCGGPGQAAWVHGTTAGTGADIAAVQR